MRKLSPALQHLNFEFSAQLNANKKEYQDWGQTQKREISSSSICLLGEFCDDDDVEIDAYN